MFVESTFLKDLLDSAPASELLEEASWPPEGYDGAEADGALATALMDSLTDASESTDMDYPYGCFVAAPGSSVDGELEAVRATVTNVIDDLSDIFGQVVAAFSGEAKSEPFGDIDFGKYQSLDAAHLFLDVPPGKLKELVQEDSEWWRGSWTESEYQARAAASAVVAKNLSDARRWTVPLEGDWSLVYYEGTSPTGARLGVIAARHGGDRVFVPEEIRASEPPPAVATPAPVVTPPPAVAEDQADDSATSSEGRSGVRSYVGAEPEQKVASVRSAGALRRAARPQTTQRERAAQAPAAQPAAPALAAPAGRPAPQPAGPSLSGRATPAASPVRARPAAAKAGPAPTAPAPTAQPSGRAEKAAPAPTPSAPTAQRSAPVQAAPARAAASTRRAQRRARRPAPAR